MLYSRLFCFFLFNFTFFGTTALWIDCVVLRRTGDVTELSSRSEEHPMRAEAVEAWHLASN